jgi:hypothetical protein
MIGVRVIILDRQWNKETFGFHYQVRDVAAFVSLSY